MARVQPPLHPCSIIKLLFGKPVFLGKQSIAKLMEIGNYWASGTSLEIGMSLLNCYWESEDGNFHIDVKTASTQGSNNKSKPHASHEYCGWVYTYSTEVSMRLQNVYNKGKLLASSQTGIS